MGAGTRGSSSKSWGSEWTPRRGGCSIHRGARLRPGRIVGFRRGAGRLVDAGPVLGHGLVPCAGAQDPDEVERDGFWDSRAVGPRLGHPRAARPRGLRAPHGPIRPHARRGGGGVADLQLSFPVLHDAGGPSPLRPRNGLRDDRAGCHLSSLPHVLAPLLVRDDVRRVLGRDVLGSSRERAVHALDPNDRVRRHGGPHGALARGWIRVSRAADLCGLARAARGPGLGSRLVRFFVASLVAGGLAATWYVPNFHAIAGYLTRVTLGENAAWYAPGGVGLTIPQHSLLCGLGILDGPGLPMLILTAACLVASRGRALRGGAAVAVAAVVAAIGLIAAASGQRMAGKFLLPVMPGVALLIVRAVVSVPRPALRTGFGFAVAALALHHVVALHLPVRQRSRGVAVPVPARRIRGRFAHPCIPQKFLFGLVEAGGGSPSSIPRPSTTRFRSPSSGSRRCRCRPIRESRFSPSMSSSRRRRSSVEALRRGAGSSS